jgi:hypothetical protein
MLICLVTADAGFAHPSPAAAGDVPRLGIDTQLLYVAPTRQKVRPGRHIGAAPTGGPRRSRKSPISTRTASEAHREAVLGHL